MFEANNHVSANNKYKIEWVELPPVQFQSVIPGWLDQIKRSRITGGTSSSDRKKLGDEFFRLLHIYHQILTEMEPHGARSMATQRAEVNIRWFKATYLQKFRGEPAAPMDRDSNLKLLIQKKADLSGKLKLLDRKHELINYWLRGVDDFPEHRDGTSVMFQYMGNAPSEKVRLFLEVLCSDANKVVSFKEPGAFKTQFEAKAGLETAGDNGKLYKVQWTDEEFRKAVKAEIGASYGVKASGSCELEVKGLKATLSGEAWAGARANAQGEASWGAGQGGSVKGSVEAEIGVKLTAAATIDVADIFLCEASAEAFAGAMAKAEVEVTATVDGVKVKLAAEAFAGAKLTGKASATLRFQGYDIFKADAEASLTAGIGAKFGLEFEASVFGGTSLKLEAGTTFGVGADAATKFTVHADNIARAAYSFYFTTYLHLLGKDRESRTWKMSFRELEDNKALFLKGRDVIEEHMKTVILERNRLFSEFSAYQQLKGLKLFRETGSVV